MEVGKVLKRSSIGRGDALALLQFVTGRKKTYLLAHDDAKISSEEFTLFRLLCNRRRLGVPLQYLTEEIYFRDNKFYINTNVLVPRQETEILSEVAARLLKKNNKEIGCILDLGTGSGVVGISLAAINPRLKVDLTDICLKALLVARKNCFSILGSKHQVNFYRGDWFEAVLPGKKYDLIVSNPPYISSGDVCLTKGGLQFEPSLALKGGRYGLDHIFEILENAPLFMTRNAWIVIEHGYDQGEICKKYFLDKGYRFINQEKDFSGNVRVTAGQVEKGADKR